MDDKTKIFTMVPFSGRFFCFLFAQSALIFLCTALNSPEAGDAALTIVRQRQNLRAEKVIARKNTYITRRNQKLSSILHRYLMTFTQVSDP